MKFLSIGIGVFTAVAGLATPVQAATIIFDSCSEPSLCNQMTMTTTLNGSAIDVSVTAPAGYGIFGDSGANLAFGFNVNGSELGLTVTIHSTGFELGDPNQDLGGGFGDFEYIIEGPHTGNGALLPLEFTVMRTLGFLTASDLFEGNDPGGYIAAAHLRNSDTRNGITGFGAAQIPGGNTAVPEPATMMLLGTGLLMAVRARKRVVAPQTIDS